ncbi:hypothetical protein CI109_103804 [Kwoniella shandongensis]|uniref:Uncharacterized protein n=1 Tax=Kwoniella shandongensis TaxID=1734106 RepID=A0A5M6C7R2_9TREE|nr:uncharacterized protein CI109_000502 [Kwoniella shandongensis]KAA5530931.1 hypothetical protein CI109_000502 [Kwoniella shandongensis]
MHLPRTDSADGDSTPPSPFSYFFPLFVVVLACGGYLFWRRAKRRVERGIPLNFASSSATGIRLSEDGPPTHSFISNNASTDSLPSHALDDLPILPQHQHPALSQSSSAYTDLPISRLPTNSAPPLAPTGGILGRARRSMKTRGQVGPIEGGDEDEDGESSESEGGEDLFQIGDGDADGEEDEPDLGPLGKR